MAVLDVVIPCHGKDAPVLPLCIDSVREYTRDGVRDVYVVSSERYTDKAIWIPERDMPCRMGTAHAMIKNRAQCGWYYQQVMQFYLPDVIDTLSDHFLLINADVVWMQPVTHIIDGRVAMNHNDYVHEPYRNFIRKLVGPINMDLSGICHYMVYNKKRLLELREYVEMRHERLFDETFYACADQSNDNGASEFELYYQWMTQRYPNDVIKRRLRYDDKGDYWNRDKYQAQGFDYIAFHAYMRGE